MYGAAITAVSCLRANTEAHIAWMVSSTGLPAHDPTEVITLTAGGGNIGSLCNGLLNQHVEFIPGSTRGRLVHLELTGTDALIAGIPEGGTATVAIAPASVLPESLWTALLDRKPVMLSATVEHGTLHGFVLGPIDDAIDGSGTRFEISDQQLHSCFVPVQRLAVFGNGPIVDALTTYATALGWQVGAAGEPERGIGLMNALSHIDSAVIMGHDIESSSRVLEAALESDAGYIGSIGAPRMQDQRADWLAYRGVTDLSRVHGPAGLDIAAKTPAEIALSVIAEAVSYHNRTADAE
jgi:xanthine dehydrogenase accessory factor